jgi:hypothetical protein
MEIMAMIPGRHCLWDDDRIERYSMGTLPEEEVAELEEHLLVCEACQSRLRQTEAFAGGMRRAALRLIREPPARERGNRLFPKLFPSLVPSSMVPALTCAAILLGLALAVLIWIRPTPAPAFAVKLEAMRGAEPGSKAPAGRPLDVQPDLSGLPAERTYRLDLVDRDGRGIWQGATASATIPALRPGMYFMRVYSGGGELLREYGLEVEDR